MATKSIKVKIDTAVYNYCAAKWEELTGLKSKEVILSLSRHGKVPDKKSSEIIYEIKQLILSIDEFTPRVLIDKNKMQIYEQQNREWKRYLFGIIKKIQRDSKPIYLAEEVNNILKKNGCEVKCNNYILEQYLHIFGREKMTPEQIADIIQQFGGTRWDKLSITPNIQNYSFRVELKEKQKQGNKLTTKKKLKQPTQEEQVKTLFLFPYKICSKVMKDIPTDYLADISIINEFEEWNNYNKEYNLTPDYESKYLEFRNRMTTIPHTKEEHRPSITEPISATISNPIENKEECKAATSIFPTNITPSPTTPESNLNNERLNSYLREIAKKNKIYYLESNISEKKNMEYIEIFAKRSNFQSLFQILQENINAHPNVQAKDIMAFIRDVALRSATDWNFNKK